MEKALSKLKNGKAAGNSNILPEMFKVGRRNEDFVGMLTDLVSTVGVGRGWVWGENVSRRNGWMPLLSPFPRKETYTAGCDNWRWIALLDVVGKLVAKIVQNRLQVLAERELSESQCGFRRGCGCTDMIFMVRQLAEKAIEHQTKQYFVFVDLRKTYDSVLRGIVDCIEEAWGTRCAGGHY